MDRIRPIWRAKRMILCLGEHSEETLYIKLRVASRRSLRGREAPAKISQLQPRLVGFGFVFPMLNPMETSYTQQYSLGFQFGVQL